MGSKKVCMGYTEIVKGYIYSEFVGLILFGRPSDEDFSGLESTLGPFV